MTCVQNLGYEVILEYTSFKECRTYIEKHFTDIYYVDPGFLLFDKRMIGVPPIALAIEGEDTVILPYTKPCFGTYLLRVVSAEGADTVRANARKKP
ncbi:MAG: DUF1894 domain-containing protein [Methanocalculus sp. MSAO_Arc2]|uniref:DUF1894 domain-containing protein n=1 Tax=Methanocalculus sp. MSAO_Arc2 TaxID=2293855 RepID=UPI000FF04F16|nr:MAG: DUF1894 domain-containing protein [Methanocalculus sp. MSAO_Arc2]